MLLGPEAWVEAGEAATLIIWGVCQQDPGPHPLLPGHSCRSEVLRRRPYLTGHA